MNWADQSKLTSNPSVSRMSSSPSLLVPSSASPSPAPSLSLFFPFREYPRLLPFSRRLAPAEDVGLSGSSILVEESELRYDRVCRGKASVLDVLEGAGIEPLHMSSNMDLSFLCAEVIECVVQRPIRLKVDL